MIGKHNHGLMLGLALVKPQLTLLFLLIPLFKKQWKTLVSAGLYLLISSLIISLWINTSPVQLVRQVFTSANLFENNFNSGLAYLLHLAGFGATGALKLWALVLGFSACAALLYHYRQKPLVFLISIPCLIGQIWTYSRRYDQSLLLLLFFPLTLLAVQHRKYGFIWLLFGISLWFPTTASQWKADLVPFVQFGIHIAALIVILTGC